MTTTQRLAITIGTVALSIVLATLPVAASPDRATFHGACSDNGTRMSWNWTGVPTDDREPGLDSYFVQVVDTVTGEPIGWYPGAEDNAYGESYHVTVIPGRDYYVQVVNDARGFHFESDVVVSCQAKGQTQSEPIEQPEPTRDPTSALELTLWSLSHAFVN